VSADLSCDLGCTPGLSVANSAAAAAKGGLCAVPLRNTCLCLFGILHLPSFKSAQTAAPFNFSSAHPVYMYHAALQAGARNNERSRVDAPELPPRDIAELCRGLVSPSD